MLPDHRPKPPPDPVRQRSQPVVRLGDAEIIPPPGHEPVQFTDDLPNAASAASGRDLPDPFFEPLYRLPVKAVFRILSRVGYAELTRPKNLDGSMSTTNRSPDFT